MPRPPTEYWNDVRCRRQGLANYQQEDDESQEDGDLEVDLLARLDRQKEAEERDGVDEEAGKDEVDDVEQAAALHMNGESDVRIWLVTACVDSLMALHGNYVHVPLLILTVTHEQTAFGNNEKSVPGDTSF